MAPLSLGLSVALLLTDAGRGDIADQTAANLIYVDSQPLILTIQSRGALITSLLIPSAGGRPGRAGFCTSLAKQQDSQRASNAPVLGVLDDIGPGQTVPLRVRLATATAPLSGQLALITYDATRRATATSFRQLEVDGSPFAPLAWWPLWVAAAGGAFLCIYSLLALPRLGFKRPLIRRMGPASWDFSKSWASNITVVGGLFSMVLALAVLPEQTHYISRSAYAALNVFFNLLVGAAPFLFNATRTPVPAAHPDQPHEPPLEGYVGTFLLASAITVAAVLGQLGTLLIVVAELARTGVPPPLLNVIWQGLTVLLAVLALVYSCRSVLWTIKCQSGDPIPRGQVEAAPARTAPLPQWSLL